MKGFNKCYFEPHLGYDKTHAEFNSQKANNLCFFFSLEFHPEKKKKEKDSSGKALNLCHAQGLIHTRKKIASPTFIFLLPLWKKRISRKDPALSSSVKPSPSLLPIRPVSSAFMSSKVLVIKAQAILSPHHNELLVSLGIEGVCCSLDWYSDFKADKYSKGLLEILLSSLNGKCQLLASS